MIFESLRRKTVLKTLSFNSQEIKKLVHKNRWRHSQVFIFIREVFLHRQAFLLIVLYTKSYFVESWNEPIIAAKSLEIRIQNAATISSIIRILLHKFFHTESQKKKCDVSCRGKNFKWNWNNSFLSTFFFRSIFLRLRIFLKIMVLMLTISFFLFLLFGNLY